MCCCWVWSQNTPFFILPTAVLPPSEPLPIFMLLFVATESVINSTDILQHNKSLPADHNSGVKIASLTSPPVSHNQFMEGLNVSMMSISCEGCEVGLSRKQGEQLPVMQKRACCAPIRQSDGVQGNKAGLSMKES